MCQFLPEDWEAAARQTGALRRAQGIGSGSTESLCKTMARRLKGPGMRWDPAGADAILNLAALQDSDTWEHYWKSPVQQN